MIAVASFLSSNCMWGEKTGSKQVKSTDQHALPLGSSDNLSAKSMASNTPETHPYASKAHSSNRPKVPKDARKRVASA